MRNGCKRKRSTDQEESKRCKTLNKKEKYAIAEKTLRNLEPSDTRIFPWASDVVLEQRKLQAEWARLSSADQNLLEVFACGGATISFWRPALHGERYDWCPGFFWSALATLNPELCADFLNETHGHFETQRATSFYSLLEGKNMKDFERATQEMLGDQRDVKELSRAFDIGLAKTWLWLFAEGTQVCNRTQLSNQCSCRMMIQWTHLRKTVWGELELVDATTSKGRQLSLDRVDRLDRLQSGSISVTLSGRHVPSCQSGPKYPINHWIVPHTREAMLEDLASSNPTYLTGLTPLLILVVPIRDLHPIILDYVRRVRVVRPEPKKRRKKGFAVREKEERLQREIQVWRSLISTKKKDLQ
jgi:hypothetical protein